MKNIKLSLSILFSSLILAPVAGFAGPLSDELSKPQVSESFINKFTERLKNNSDRMATRQILKSWKPIPGILIHDDPSALYVLDNNIVLYKVKVLSADPVVLKVNDLPELKIKDSVVGSIKQWKKAVGAQHASNSLRFWMPGILSTEARADDPYFVDEKLLVLYTDSLLGDVHGPGRVPEVMKDGRVLTEEPFSWRSFWASRKVPEVQCGKDPIEGRAALYDRNTWDEIKETVEVKFSAFKDTRVILNHAGQSYLVQLEKVASDQGRSPYNKILNECKFEPNFKNADALKEWRTEYDKAVASNSRIVVEALKSQYAERLSKAAADYDGFYSNFAQTCSALTRFRDFDFTSRRLPGPFDCKVNFPVKTHLLGTDGKFTEVADPEIEKQIFNVNRDMYREQLKDLEGKCKKLISRFDGMILGYGRMDVTKCMDAACEKTDAKPLTDEEINGVFFKSPIDPIYRDGYGLVKRTGAVRSAALHAIATLSCCTNKPCIEDYNSRVHAGAKLIPAKDSKSEQ